MEFLAGIIFTLFALFIGHKIYQSVKRRKERQAYVPPSGPRPNIPKRPDSRLEP